MYKLPVHLHGSEVEFEQKLIFFIGGTQEIVIETSWFEFVLSLQTYPLYFPFVFSKVSLDTQHWELGNEVDLMWSIGHVIASAEFGLKECTAGLSNILDDEEEDLECEVHPHHFEEFYEKSFIKQHWRHLLGDVHTGHEEEHGEHPNDEEHFEEHFETEIN